MIIVASLLECSNEIGGQKSRELDIIAVLLSKSSQEVSLENASVSSRDGVDGVGEFPVIFAFYVFCNDVEIIYILSAPGNANFIIAR